MTAAEPSISPATRHRGPELLAPAGNWDCARAAVANGADAIYFGLPRFNARLRADNFTADDLPELMRFLKRHRVRGYAALNVLIFPHELHAALTDLELAAAAGVDAVIVQDLGLARLCKQTLPTLELHASTQMTLTSPEGLQFARRWLDLDLAVLARELSLRELEKFRATEPGALPLEVFVHGALCVAYSGQCLTSESLGRRSANRGECAQACRLPYTMLVDGQPLDLGPRRYLLSPQDLAAIDEIPRLIELGIRSFKIEGRLKSPEYVAAVTAAYRRAIDAAVTRQPVPADHARDDRYAMEMSFSRGFFSGWFHGVNHQRLVPALSGKKRGIHVGTVRRVHQGWIELDQLRVPLRAGDGVVLVEPNPTDPDLPAEQEQGGRLFEVRGRRLSLHRSGHRLRQVRPGTGLWKTDDPQLNKRLRQSFHRLPDPPADRQPLRLRATGAAGQPLQLTALAADRTELATCQSSLPLQPARTHPLTADLARERLAKLGDSGYHLDQLDWQLPPGLTMPPGEINRLRRAIVAALHQRQPQHQPPAAAPTPPAPRPPAVSLQAQLLDLHQAATTDKTTTIAAPARLHALCRTEAQAAAAASAGIDRLYLDFEDIRRFADTVARLRADHPALPLWLATPRIQKAGESGFFKLIERAAPDGVLVRNLGAIDHFHAAGLPMAGDFSLNTANGLTAALLREAGLETLTISYDLSLPQVLDLLTQAPPSWFELTLHQHMPMFHMEHCAFAAFLSEGTDFTNCGRPCEKHRVKLRDRVGMEHPLHADVGCRNTLFNAQAQTGAAHADTLLDAGLRQFRIELLEQTPPETIEVLGLYRDVIDRRRTGLDLWRQLRAVDRLGVTTGTWSDDGHARKVAAPAITL